LPAALSGLRNDRRLTQVSPSLWWYRDTCNVYLWASGTRGLLIDFGSGGILDELEETGVREIVAVAHTHHHRDQCGGDDRAVAAGIPIWVPARERHLFDQVEAFWRLRNTYDSYDASSIGFTRSRSVPVARSLGDYDRIEWAGGDIEVFPSPGHTKGSISLLAEIDSRSIAFTGDLISGHGRVPTLHDLQWQYGTPDAVGAALYTATNLASRRPTALMPSHGLPIGEGEAALRALGENLGQLARLLSETRRNRLWTEWPLSTEQSITQVLPHLWVNDHSVANTYALVDDAGDALILDYGFPSWDHSFADLRFVGHTLDAFQAEAGVARIVAAVPSHYHDDHLAGVPWLQREHGTQAWVHESFADLVAEPTRVDLPCLWAEPIRVDRVLVDGDAVQHAGATLEVFHMPGHTMFALGLAGVLDGVRVAYTGDNLLAGALTPLRTAAPIYRNVLRADSIRLGVERLIEHEPELLLTGHSGAIEVSRADLDEVVAWARELELVVARLVPIPGLEDEALDPYVARFDPYRVRARAGDEFTTKVVVTNHATHPRTAVVRLRLPTGWESEPFQEGTVVAGGGSSGSLTFRLAIPDDAPLGRAVLTADVVIEDEPRGELAETLVDVLPRVLERDSSVDVTGMPMIAKLFGHWRSAIRYRGWQPPPPEVGLLLQRHSHVARPASPKESPVNKVDTEDGHDH
jgi:glyoxylase-like metal-dependent hydrolase (beta-lactamase superfamily II)